MPTGLVTRLLVSAVLVLLALILLVLLSLAVLVLLSLAVVALILLSLAVVALVLLSLAVLVLLASVLLSLAVVALVLLSLAVLVLRTALADWSCWPMPNFFSTASSPSLICCGCCWANCSASFFRLSNSLTVASVSVVVFDGRLSRCRRLADRPTPYPGPRV